MSKSYYEKRMVDRCIVTSRLLKPIKQRLIYLPSFRLSKSHYSRSVLLTNALIILVLFFHIAWIVEFIKFQKHVKFPFSFCRITLTSNSKPPFVCEFSPVIILTAEVKSRGNLRTKRIFVIIVVFKAWKVGRYRKA
jgi:hypothetical protein